MNATRAKTRWRVGALVVFLGILLWLVIVQPWRPAEPVYKGKRLTYWLMQYHRSEMDQYHSHPHPPGVFKNSRSVEQALTDASEAVQHCGTNAIPILLQMADAPPDSKLKLKFIALVRKQSLIRLNLSTQRDYHEMAYLGFKCLDEDSAKLAIPGLVRLLHSEDLATRSLAVDIFAFPHVLANAGNAVPALIERLDDSDSWVRGWAVLVLGAMHQQPALVVPALMERLSGPKRTYSLYIGIMHSLEQFGTNARPAVPILLRIYKDNEDSSFSQTAAEALKKIAPETLTTDATH